MITPVHPRARGEHRRDKFFTHRFFGSSPRTRGTSSSRYGTHGRARFIPAHAGNMAFEQRKSDCRTVHPRARGEHTFSRSPVSLNCGSSPRTRGTLRRYLRGDFQPRFIPAHAGNMHQIRQYGIGRSVHPRARGEHPPRPPPTRRRDGSSPRTRGTYMAGGNTDECMRFIPAHAGNIPTPWSVEPCTPVHPRARGEHATS